jgi:2-succinyl-6-hydroxy-2,4-cyclohexadiene-1-carboxylate synthase
MTRLGPPGAALDVRVTGSGPAVLLLHGFTGTSAGWAPIAEGLAEGHRVIRPDLLGHGRSDAPHDPVRYALPAQAAGLRSVLRDLEAEPAAVVGYSMGARLALVLALERPAAVTALALLSPSAGLRDPQARARRRAEDERWATMLEVAGLAAFVDAWAAQPVFESQVRLKPEARERLRSERLSQHPLALAASLRGAGQGVMEPLHEHLGRIRVPTLVVAGALDRVGMARAREVVAGLPEGRLEVVESAGHAPHLELPDRLLELLSAFLGPSRASAIPVAHSIPEEGPSWP